MNKKTLGVCIPYYKNSEQCEIEFKKLMESLANQLNTKINLIKNDIIICVYEDGQVSDWLKKYKSENIMIKSCKTNKGVSVARNWCIDYLIDKVDYILFIDSDDKVADNYLLGVWQYCFDRTHEIIETSFYINDVLMRFNRDEIRSCASSSAIMTSVIGEHRFNEKLQIGEDTTFMNEIVDLTKHRKKYCPVGYYYQLGINPNSLIKRYEREEIDKER